MFIIGRNFVILFTFNAVLCGILPRNYTNLQYLNNPSIQTFRRYVQIDTSKENNLEEAVEFWRREASAVGLEFAVHRPAGKPVCVLTWRGSDHSKPSIMLNSHMDVVPVETELWTHPPFAAEIDENGDIFGRGTQDDKDVAIQYLQAIRQLKQDNVTLKRTLHMTLMPDEETGHQGMEEFVKTKEFVDLNVGFALDEGIVSPDDTVYFTYTDKRAWKMKISVTGATGHTASIQGETAVQKLQRVMNEINKFREEQGAVQTAAEATDYGAYDSVNINVIHGGQAVNVVPGKMYLIVDARWAASRDINQMNEIVASWVSVAGNDTEVEYIQRAVESDATAIDDSNLFWKTIQETATNIDLKIKPVVCPAISDMIYVRSRGIPALGFAPKAHTENRMHGSNEYLNAASFLRGIEIYVHFLKALGNL